MPYLQPLLTRQYGPNAKGSRLTIQEMDNNLLYLDTAVDLQEGTYADWTSASQSAALIPNSRIKITDRGDTGIILTCQSSSSFSYFGMGGFLNADIQGVGNYTNADYTVSSSRGVWYPELDYFTINYENLVVSGSGLVVGDTVTSGSINGKILSIGAGNDITVYTTSTSIPSDWAAVTSMTSSNGTTFDVTSVGARNIVNENVVIHKNIHYIMNDISQATGGNPIIDNNAYIELTRATRNGYIEEWDKITYWFSDDQIIWREDARGNKIPGNSISTFQWGDNNILDFKIETIGCDVDTQNNRGIITGVVRGINSHAYLYNNSGEVLIDVNGDACYVNGENNTGTFQAHVAGYNNGTYSPNNTGTIVVYIEGGSAMDAQSNKGNIYGKYYNGAYANHNYNTGSILDGDFNQSAIYLSLASGQTHSNCKYTISNTTITFPTGSSFYNKEITNWGSTFDVTKDITGLTNLDLSSNLYAGIVHLSSSNATETLITANLNYYFDTKLIPDNGLAVTINNKGVSSMTPNDICLTNAYVFLTGRDNNLSDYLILKADNNQYIRETGRSLLTEAS